MLARIDAAGRAAPRSRILLRPALAGETATSWLGGAPALASGVAWPVDANGARARFLAQLRLDEDARSVCLFELGHDVVALEGDVSARAPENARGLMPLRVPIPPSPADADDWDAEYSPRQLLASVSGLREALAARVDEPLDVLPYLLAAFPHGHELDTYHVVLVGGEPHFIQAEHELACSRCSKPLRFLFQVGDVVELVGDAPVIYVYGCDADRELRAVVDLH